MRRIILLSCFAMFLAASTYADNAEKLAVMSFSLQGQPSGSLSQVRLKMGPGITKVVRVYGHPSGQLLAVYANSAGASPVSESDWFKEKFQHRAAGRIFPLASLPFAEGREVVVQGHPAEASDTGLRVHVFGEWPTESGGVEERDDEFIIATNPRKFAVTISLQ